MKIELIEPSDGDVIAKGSYEGGPSYEFVVMAEGHVNYCVLDTNETHWAAPDVISFYKIVKAWNQYRAEVTALRTEQEQLERVTQLRNELSISGAFPTHLHAEPESLWSLLIKEAELGMS